MHGVIRAVSMLVSYTWVRGRARLIKVVLKFFRPIRHGLLWWPPIRQFSLDVLVHRLCCILLGPFVGLMRHGPMQASTWMLWVDKLVIRLLNFRQCLLLSL